MSGTPPHMTTLMGVAQRGWSGQICVLPHLWDSFVSFFFFCFLQRAPRSHSLTDRHYLYAKTRVSGQGCAFWGSRQYSTTFRGLTPHPPKKLKKWAGIGISQPNRQNSKIAIYRSPMKISASNFTDRLITGGTIEKVQNYIKWNREGVTWPTVWVKKSSPYNFLQYFHLG